MKDNALDLGLGEVVYDRDMVRQIIKRVNNSTGITGHELMELMAYGGAFKQSGGVFEYMLDEDNQLEMGEQFDRHTMMLTNKHTIAVTMDWIHGLMADALKFLTKGETDKYVRNLYLVRLATDDLFVGAIYHELEVGEEREVHALQALLQMIRTQIDRDLAGGITRDGTYTLDDARRIADQLWYFATCGLVGIPTQNLAYGCDVLVKDGRYQRPRTLINTGDLANNVKVAAALNELL